MAHTYLAALAGSSRTVGSTVVGVAAVAAGNPDLQNHHQHIGVYPAEVGTYTVALGQLRSLVERSGDREGSESGEDDGEEFDLHV